MCEHPTGVALGVMVLVASCSARPPERDSKVGRTVLNMEDPDRTRFDGPDPRPLRTTLWYPTKADEPERAWGFGVFEFGWAVQDGPLPSPDTQFPPILLSHGTGGSAAQLGWLAETLASRGAIVAAVDHHGNTAVEPAQLPHGFVLWWERPRDLSVLVDLLLDDPRLGPLIDRDRVSAAGFSLGGYSVLALAGAQVSMEQHAIHCASNVDSAACALPPEAGFDPTELERLRQEDPDFKASLQRAGQSYADDRVSRVYAIAPVLGPAITGPSLSSTKTPMAITVGTEDRQAWDSAIAYREHLPAGLEWREIEGLGHYTFLARCTWRGRWFAGPICHDRPGVDRRAVHRDIADHAASFLLH